MANYYASARSNYFRVKDVIAFKEWAASRGLGVWEQQGEQGDTPVTLYAIYPRNDDSGGWPSGAFNAEDELEEFNVFEELAPHLADGWVAILLEVGAEKLRYLCGHAHVISADGKVSFISLEEEALKRAKKKGQHVTEALY